MLVRASSGSGGGGADMSPLFGQAVVQFMNAGTKIPICPVIGVNHVNVARVSGSGGSIIYGVDNQGNETQIYNGADTTTIDVKDYILLRQIRGTVPATASANMTITYVD